MTPVWKNTSDTGVRVVLAGGVGIAAHLLPRFHVGIWVSRGQRNLSGSPWSGWDAR